MIKKPHLMNSKVLNILLILSSLGGYLAWGGNQHIFLYKAEAEILSKLLTNPASVLHPFTILPMLSQLLLLITLFQKTPSKILSYWSIAGLGLLMGFMLIIGIISLQYKIVISTIPFIIISIVAIKHYRKVN
jgi:hypothetical protein